MNLKCLLSTAVSCVLLFSEVTAAEQSSVLKKRVLSDLESIHNMFAVKYAPLFWKQKYLKWDLDQAAKEAKDKINSMAGPSLKDCQIVIRDFFKSACDYHVGVKFFSTESSSLPFMLKGADKRYFVCEVDEASAAAVKFPFNVGDEILQFDRRPVSEVVDELRVSTLGTKNTYETDVALTELSLTSRNGMSGDSVPKGFALITGRRIGSSEIITVAVPWDYHPEEVKDFSEAAVQVPQKGVYCGKDTDWNKDFQKEIRRSKFFDKRMMLYAWDENRNHPKSQHTIGSRNSFVPALGRVVWENNPASCFDAYIFITATQKRVGYIRIPHYLGGEEEVQEFGYIMNLFQRCTDSLVIDQLNNPGGSIFYMYGLLSTLTNRPLVSPKHHLALTQQEVMTSLQMLPYISQVRDDATAKQVLGNSMDGYNIDYEFVCVLRRFCNFVIDQWNKGNLYTDLTHIFGVDTIRPHPSYRYTKPILVLINSLDFSGGDFFPSILQDNKRAIIMGTRTAGAGGFVLQTSFPNHSGIQGVGFTGSLAERINGKPLENLGVEPDIKYSLTPEDLQFGYGRYVAEILRVVNSM